MRLLNYIVCVIFTFVSLGGNIYIHQCKDTTLLSFYSEIDTGNCPFCEKHHNKDHKMDDHCAGECKDSTLKIDQLSDQNFNTTHSSFVQLSPAITPILWILDFAIDTKDVETYHSLAYLLSFSDSSPPLYLQNCIFRI